VWRWLSLGFFFVGAVGYADDVAMLATCPALRIMLRFCVNFTSIHGLTFNTTTYYVPG